MNLTKEQATLVFNLAVTGTRQMSLEQAAQMLQELTPIKTAIDGLGQPSEATEVTEATEELIT